MTMNRPNYFTNKSINTNTILLKTINSNFRSMEDFRNQLYIILKYDEECIPRPKNLIKKFFNIFKNIYPYKGKAFHGLVTLLPSNKIISKYKGLVSFSKNIKIAKKFSPFIGEDFTNIIITQNVNGLDFTLLLSDVLKFLNKDGYFNFVKPFLEEEEVIAFYNNEECDIDIISDRSNIDIISSLLDSNQDKEELFDYIEDNDEIEFNNINMSEFLKWLWIDRHDIINNNERLKQYFINSVMKNYSTQIITYRGISFDNGVDIDLEYIKEESLNKLISTTKDINIAKSFALSYGNGILLECSSNKYVDLSDFEVNNEKEVIMINPNIRIIKYLDNIKTYE